jgi:glycosyltransferase involved in cell wall biosynthesis
MKVEFNTLYWDNTPKEQIDAHKSVTEHFEIPINYYEENTPHGKWMNRVMCNSTSDLIVFFDSDCIPINKDNMMDCIRYVQKTKTFLGIAQASNHIPPKSHVYAAPAFYVIAKKCWELLGRPSFAESRRGDVAEEVSYIAEDFGIRYRCLYPSTFEREPVEGVWPLGNYGYYGVGTTFEDTVYHLYQGRIGNNIQLFVERCNEIVQGTFDNRFHNSAITRSYKGRIVP